MAKGFVGILAVELRFSEAGSLKDKRQYLRSAKAQLQNRFGASVAETELQDVWQRARLVIALVAAEVGIENGHQVSGRVILKFPKVDTTL